MQNTWRQRANRAHCRAAGGVRHECDARLRVALGTLRDTFSSFEISSQAIPILAALLVDRETVDIR
jgi:hypothetical protein